MSCLPHRLRHTVIASLSRPASQFGSVLLLRSLLYPGVIGLIERYHMLGYGRAGTALICVRKRLFMGPARQWLRASVSKLMWAVTHCHLAEKLSKGVICFWFFFLMVGLLLTTPSYCQTWTKVPNKQARGQLLAGGIGCSPVGGATSARQNAAQHMICCERSADESRWDEWGEVNGFLECFCIGVRRAKAGKVAHTCVSHLERSLWNDLHLFSDL